MVFKANSKTKELCPLILVVFFLILDRLTKWFILKKPDFYSSSFLDLKLFRNTKLYFVSLNPILLYLLIGSVLLIFIILFLKTRNPSLAFIVLGGLSNFFDRIYFGYVIDWIKVFFLPISVFNIADLMIIFGIIMILFQSLKLKKFF